MSEITLNDQQLEAVKAIEDFLNPSNLSYFFLLSGAAGTGKTTTMQEVVKRINARLVFTAPTNKATRVLRDTFSSLDFDDNDDGYKPETCTIYSLLGLRITPTGALKELTGPEKEYDLRRYKAVVVDEASMINSILWDYISKTAQKQKVKFIFLGDPCQLPPVKELRSKVWESVSPVTLTEVMRHDNQILTLATKLREVMQHPMPSVTIVSDHDTLGGVYRCGPVVFSQRLTEIAKSGAFSSINTVKVIAWRNVTVDKLNQQIRQAVYHDPPASFLPEDRVIVTEPAKDLKSGKIRVTTDSEGTVLSTEVAHHPNLPAYTCRMVKVQMDDGGVEIFTTLHENSQADYTLYLSALQNEAKSNPRKWKEFWEFKESFHSLRFGYAITAHRSQGSTYQDIFVDMGDILKNRNREEAFRCLYVACTRAKRNLYIM